MERISGNKSVCRPAVAGWILLLFLAQAGCAHRAPSLPDAGSDRAGSAGIVSAEFLPEVVLDLPGKGRVDGAVRGAGRGFLLWSSVPLRFGAEGLRGCSGEACGYIAVGVLAVAAATGAVGAVFGGLEGAIRAIPAREAEEIETATRYLADLKIQETMRDRVLDAAEDAGGCAVVALPGAGPAAVDCVVAYGGLAAEGIGSVVEVAVLSVGFRGERWGTRPPLSVVLAVRVRRYRTGDGQMTDEWEFRHRSEERLFADWMADGAALLEEEFREGYWRLAEEIVVAMRCEPGPDPPGE
ncbi:MAG: hypothetical protein H6Q80_1313 [Deltaproteobacteria bacterium]|nr:hypothetical protein [Deltaproteobacteria bacterium]